MILFSRDDKGRRQNIMTAYEHILARQTFFQDGVINQPSLL